MQRILIVGAGFAGAVIARELAETNKYLIDIIDSRNHIAGNAYDYTNEFGIRIHKYGPHIWHTSNEKAHEWFSRFTNWIPYRHKVRAILDSGDTVPLPINRDTINKVLGFSFKTNDEAEAFLESERIHYPEITNSQQLIYSTVGKRLGDIFFAPYTKKMWGVNLKELSASVAGRISTKLSDEGLYFPTDTIQCMPTDGYTAAFEKILNHPNITIHLNKEFNRDMESAYFHIFNSMPIDVYFDNEFGELPYRSLRFFNYHIQQNSKFVKMFTVPTLNFTDDGRWTRVTNWKLYPNHGHNDEGATITFEEPCDYKDNNFERYYPVKDVHGKFRKLYELYKEKAASNQKMTFIGRCGMYVYIDMHQAISSSLSIAKEFCGNSTN